MSPEDLVQIAGKDAEGVRSCMRLLLEHGAPIDATDAFEYTALLAAAEWGRTESVKLLLELRASPHSTCPAEGEGYDCLIAAVQNAMPDVVRVLLDAGSSNSSPFTAALSTAPSLPPPPLPPHHVRPLCNGQALVFFERCFQSCRCRCAHFLSQLDQRGQQACEGVNVGWAQAVPFPFLLDLIGVCDGLF